MYRLILIPALLFAAVLMAAEPVNPSPAVQIDSQRVTVSGVSAGGQMAHQLHIAYPDVFSGVGIIAGGPFGCADGSLGVAMARCMGKVDGKLPLAQFTQDISSASGEGRLGDTALLSDDPVWIFHGTLDLTVAAVLSDATVALYTEFMPAENIRYVNDVEAAHNFPTRGYGNDCGTTESPFIGNCDFDAAGELLQHLYGNLEKPSTEPQAELLETTLPGAVAAGLSDTAYLYIPPACKQGEPACKAHLVLHGCAQSSVQIGTEFIEKSGYLPWAETNSIVLAFPQVAPAAANPFACWDWWGYSGAAYRWREGAQMKVLTDWIVGMAMELPGPAGKHR